MKKIFLIAVGVIALASCRQTGMGEDRNPYDASETGTNTSEEGNSGGGVRTTPEATSDSTEIAPGTESNPDEKVPTNATGPQ